MTLIYEDGAVKAHYKHNGATLGHIVITPHENKPYLSELPEDVVVQLWYCASFAATAIFEGLGVHGTNIVCYEGSAVELHVLGRMPEDGAGLKIGGQRKDPSELAPVAKTVKEALWYVGKKQEKPPERTHEPAPVKAPAKNDLRIQQLRRKP